MARSRSVLAIVLALPALAACSAIIGLSDYKKGECSGGGACLNDGGSEAGDVDAAVEAGRGSQPVSWALWRMPNYQDAAGVQADFELTAGSTVTDHVTGLVWQSKSDKTPIGFQAASDECAAITPPGAWRLPKRIELVTLLDFSKPSAFIDSSFFTIVADVVWTSSESRTVGVVTSSFWTVDFRTGIVNTLDGTNGAAITLCVKAQ